MFSTLTDRGADVTLEALAAGASDYALKPSASGEFGSAAGQVQGELITRIRVHGARRRASAEAYQRRTEAVRKTPVGAATTTLPRATLPVLRSLSARPTLLAIGCSTGGPNALVELFARFPQAFDLPVVLVQHMPPIFTRMLAERLARGSKFAAAEAEDGKPLEPGKIHVAPGGKHMLLARNGATVVTRLNEDAPVNFCRPSVDPLFRSVAELYGRNALALVLTGMGEDGLEGARALRDAGGAVLAQDQETSVVWGMPGAVVKAGVAEAALPLETLAHEVQRRIGLPRGRAVA